jgi:hypothetical protein
MLSNKARLALFDIRDNGELACEFVAELTYEEFERDRGSTTNNAARGKHSLGREERAGTLVDESPDQEPAKAWTARTGQASASGSAWTTRFANTDAGSLSQVERMIGERTTPTPIR